MRWYTGTANVSANDAVIRRLGDLFEGSVPTGLPWYTPDQMLANDPHGDPAAVWEGIGTGWFHSIMGGGGIGNGRILRPYDLKDTPQRNLDDAVVNGILELAASDFADRLPSSRLANREVNRLVLDGLTVGGQSAFDYYLGRRRASVQEENTFDRSMQGDYAVPTLFNGNFDAIAFNAGSAQTIPSWSLSQASLVDWREIGGLMERWDGQSNYLEKLGINPFSSNYQSNYALELNSGESVTRDRFVIPDWGVLRINLHVPNPTGGVLKVILEGSGFKETKEIELVGGLNVGNDQDNYRINYGREGFETFHIDIPQSLRGKVATLRLEAIDNTIYVDDVFFKSTHLRFGNPTLDGQEAKSDVAQFNNYLIEKPQYTLSYNKEKKIPNWVSWQLNQSWLGNIPRTSISPREPFREDPIFSELGWTGAKSVDYERSTYTRGHMIPSADRNRTQKDIKSTYLMTNILPQHPGNNNLIFVPTFDIPAWTRLEGDLRSKVVEDGRELYIIAGGYDYESVNNVLPNVPDPQNPGSTKPNPLRESGITVPAWTWKAVLSIQNSNLHLDEAIYGAEIYAVITPNIAEPASDFVSGDFTVPISHPLDELLPTTPKRQAFTNRSQWRDWRNWTVSVRDIEQLTQLDLFSEYDRRILTSPLLVSSENTDSFVEVRTSKNSVWSKDSIIEKSALQISPIQVGVGQISVTEVDAEKTSSLQISFSQNNSSQISIPAISGNQISTSEIRVSQVSPSHISASQIGTSQVSFNQIGTSQVSASQIGTSQIGSTEISSIQITPRQINSTQVNISEVPLSTHVSPEQLFSFHSSTSQTLNAIKDNALSLWNFNLQNLLNVNFAIQDLPVGHLAEAQITSFDPQGHPIGGTIILDINANGFGWFIDSTPWDNTEFSTQPAATTYRATPSSPAFGRYDLLTTLLHELGHLQGLIAGNPAYDAHVRSHNGIPTFVGNNFSIPLTVDRSHTAIPSDLMSPYLSPGMRKLPSWENLQMLQAIQNWNGGEIGEWGNEEKTLSAFQKTTPLIGITNGEFDRLDQWESRGAVQLLNSQATLSERSPLLSNLSQTFLIPQGAKALQFTLVDTDLDPSLLDPGDAFEVALLDAATLTPLVTPNSSLTHTDAFFNLQHTGQSFLSKGVTITQNPDRTRTVTLDSPTFQPRPLPPSASTCWASAARKALSPSMASAF